MDITIRYLHCFGKFEKVEVDRCCTLEAGKVADCAGCIGWLIIELFAGTGGLSEGVSPGPDLSIKAGIGWLVDKAYAADSNGVATTFRGWPAAVTLYGPPGGVYVQKVYTQLRAYEPEI